MQDWIDFYDSAHSIYVNARHRDLHFAELAEQIAAYVPSKASIVVDYSCGEALSAGRLADACGRLVLAEPAPNLRARLAERYSGLKTIEVRALDELDRLPAHSVDLVVMNSVAQYTTPDELDTALVRIHRLLKRGGQLVLGDIISPNVGALTDAVALLRFGARGGFFVSASLGLVRTALSDYRKLRTRLGLHRYAESEIVAKLSKAGFTAARAPRNLGHNQSRMTFLATA